MSGKADSITDCPNIEQIWHMQRSSQNISVSTTDFLLSHSDVGPYIHIICPEGSHVVGPSMITCMKGGVWDDVTEPSCSTSTLYGVPKSDIILISVLAACGAIVILSLTIILSHLLCYRKHKDDIHTSVDRLNRNSESIPSTSMYIGDKQFHTISVPTSATLNGRPFTRQNVHPVSQQTYDARSVDGQSIIMSCHNPSEFEYSLPRYYVQSTRIPNYNELPPPPPPHDLTENDYTDTYAHAYMISRPNDAEDMVFVNTAYSEDFPPRNYRANWENEINSVQARSHTLPRFDTRTTF